MQGCGTARNSGEQRRRGFNLAELVCVVVIIAILSAISVPRFGNSLARQRVEAAARRIVVDLALARRHAKQSNTDQAVAFVGHAGGYRLPGVPNIDHPTLMYSVSLSQEPYGVTAIEADFNGNRELVFDIHGVPDSGGTVVICVGNRTRIITVDADTGEATVSTPTIEEPLPIAPQPVDPKPLEPLPIDGEVD